jgi:hypothetical protein
MGMCIVYTAIPAGSDPTIEPSKEHAAQLAHGRIGPIALVVVMGAEHRSDRLREIGRRMEWGALLPGRVDGALPVLEDLALAAVTGAPPARVVSFARRAVFDRAAVIAVASALEAIEEGTLRRAYHQEREHLPPHADEDMVVRAHASIRDFFASARSAGNDVLLDWEYR